MGTILASTLIDRCATTLFDVNNVKWSRSELLAWLNAAQRAIAIADPAANNQTVSMQMIAGARQTVPVSGWMLLDVYCNMGLTPGNTPGRAIRLVSRKLLDGFNPNWRTATQSLDVKNFMFDPQDQDAFWVYPPSNGLGYVQINYAAIPANLAENSAIVISDAYEQQLIDYALSHAYKKDDIGDPTKAATRESDFEKGLAISMASVKGNNPNNAFDPVTPGGDET